MGLATVERDHVTRLAKTDPGAALQAARVIADPFTRCQALAWVARYSQTDEDALEIAREAEKALASASDPWEAVAGAAWPVRALAERGRAKEADALIMRSVKAAGRVDHLVRRVDALFLLVQAGWAPAGQGWSAAVALLVDSAAPASSGKAEAVHRDLVLMLAGAGREYADALAAMPEGKARRQVERRLAAGASMVPRPFFW